MRVLVLSSEGSTEQIVKAAFAPECEIVLRSPSAEAPADLQFDAVLVDDGFVSAADLDRWTTRLQSTTLLALRRNGHAPIHAPNSAWKSVHVSGQVPPTPEDLDSLREAIGRNRPARSAPLSASSSQASDERLLQAVLEATGAKVLTVDLTLEAGTATLDQWLLQAVGGPRQDPNLNVHPVDLPLLRQAIGAYLSGKTAEFSAEFRILGRSGQWEWVQHRSLPETDDPKRTPRRIVIVQTSHTAVRRAAAFQERQAQILERLVAGDELSEILVSLIQAIEANYTGAIATVARLDETDQKLYHLAGPSLPAEFHAALDGLAIGPSVGACGAAAFLKQRVVLTDIWENDSCRPFRNLFERFNLQSVWAQPIIGSEGQVLGTFAIYHRERHAPDVGEMRLIETAANLAGLAMERWGQLNSLVQVEKRLLKLADLGRLYPWDYDVEQQRFTYLGPQVETILGYKPEELLTRERWLTIIHPEDLPQVSERARRSEPNGENFMVEYRAFARDGRVVWLQGLFSRVMHNGKPVRLQGFSIDITDRKLAEGALRESEERYRILADFSSDIISRMDLEGRLLYISPACRTLLGFEPEQLIGTVAFEVIHPEDVPAVSQHWEALATQDHVVATYRTRRADGSYMWFETRGKRLAAKNGAGFEVIATSRDITEQIEYARKLREREAELAHAERLGTMGQMAAELAHELNQPLQAISNFAEAARHWLESPSDDLESLRRWNNQISQQARRAAEVVRRILNFVRKGELDRAAFDLTACVRDLQPLLEVAAKSHRAKVDYQLEDNLPEVVGDRLLIEQVIVNLFRNALEAMADRDAADRVVTVRTYATDDQRVGMSVADRGRGLDDDETQHVFEPYFTTKSDGTGMGLAICRSTIDAHEGRIWAENNEQGGATFSFVLPLQSADSAHRVRR